MLWMPSPTHSAGPSSPPPEVDIEALDAYSKAVIGAVNRVGPAVVSIQVGRNTTEREHAGGAGSGVVITPDGYL